MPFLLARAFGPLGVNKIGLIFYFKIQGKLFIIQCDKYLILSDIQTR